MSVLTICVVALGLFVSVACSSTPTPTPVPTHTPAPTPTPGYVEGEAIGLVEKFLSNISNAYGWNCFIMIARYNEFTGTQEPSGNWLVTASHEGLQETTGRWYVYKNSGIVRALDTGDIDYC